MAITPPAPKPHARPAMDEWGVYDPQQAGLAALFARIDSRADAARAEDRKPVETTTAPLVAAPERPTLRDAK
jgi:hypothetical protein